jgi:hypothetical protein
MGSSDGSEPPLFSTTSPNRTVFADRIIEPDLALLGELQYCGNGECLCHAADSAVDVGLHGRAGGLVCDPHRSDVSSLRTPYADDCAGIEAAVITWSMAASGRCAVPASISWAASVVDRLVEGECRVLDGHIGEGGIQLSLGFTRGPFS